MGAPHTPAPSMQAALQSLTLSKGWQGPSDRFIQDLGLNVDLGSCLRLEHVSRLESDFGSEL
eukprot:12023201-Alexandrium_andersonii.AAC.1